MDEQFIYPHELLLLAVWLSSPALCLGVAYHALRKYRIRPWVGVIAAIVFIVGTILGAILLWGALPHFLLPGSVVPKPGLLRLVPPFLVPAYASAILTAAMTSALAMKAQQALGGGSGKPGRAPG